ncbi:Kelch repeat-containing protein [Pseudomonas monteilii]|uniref:Kelch repeat-containing protein n=1 Tax=Pseudomonas monteilii TaxID=76759 RepID=UPI0018A50C62|nr:phage tail protein [Pseudomonas monteilii]BBV94916.1 hypothetical protein STW0522PSE72_02670 [Pseudomonas monteilii]
MGASITLAGESLISQKQSKREPLLITEFVLAHVPGLDTTQPVDREAGLPVAAQIVHRVPVTREGYLASNKVVYSLMMGSDIGDFDFNWIGLLSNDAVPVIVAYVPLQQKRKEIPPLQAGNNLTRNIILEYDGAQSLTGISVPASSWQFDFTADFTALNARLDQLQVELAKKVDQDKFAPPAAVSLDGPVLVYPGSTNVYTITDYNRFSAFTAATTLGTVSVENDQVKLVIPTVAAEGLLTLDVMRDGNKASFRLPVGAAAIEPPSLVSPVNGATDVGFQPDLSASSFVVYPVGFDKHTKTRWQLARDAGFTDLVLDYEGAQLTSLSLAERNVRLEPAKRYYLRARYVGQNLTSKWSATAAFNTAAVYIRKPMITSPVDGAPSFSQTAQFKADAFNVYGGVDTHAASRWQISTVADFSTVQADSGWSPSDLTTWTPSVSLGSAQSLFARVAYRGTNTGNSEWSATIAFTTSDPLTGTYTALASGGTARSSHHLLQSGGYLYVVGGDSATTWRYASKTNTWQQMASMPVSVQYSAGAVLNGKLYVYGGRINNASSDGTADLYCYDIATNTWTKLQPGPVGMEGGTLAAARGQLYLFGGNVAGASGSQAKLYCYNPNTNKWSTLSPASAGRVYHTCQAIGDRIFMLGGSATGDNNDHNTVEIYDVATDTWSAGPTLLYGVIWTTSATVSGLIYIHAGYVPNAPANGAYKVLQEYDPSTGKTRLVSIAGPARYMNAAAELEGSMYIFGGLLAPGSTPQTTLHRID